MLLRRCLQRFLSLTCPLNSCNVSVSRPCVWDAEAGYFVAVDSHRGVQLCVETRALDHAEQQAMHNALRASGRLVHKAEPAPMSSAGMRETAAKVPAKREWLVIEKSIGRSAFAPKDAGHQAFPACNGRCPQRGGSLRLLRWGCTTEAAAR